MGKQKEKKTVVPKSEKIPRFVPIAEVLEARSSADMEEKIYVDCLGYEIRGKATVNGRKFAYHLVREHEVSDDKGSTLSLEVIFVNPLRDSKGRRLGKLKKNQRVETVALLFNTTGNESQLGFASPGVKIAALHDLKKDNLAARRENELLQVLEPAKVTPSAKPPSATKAAPAVEKPITPAKKTAVKKPATPIEKPPVKAAKPKTAKKPSAQKAAA